MDQRIGLVALGGMVVALYGGLLVELAWGHRGLWHFALGDDAMISMRYAYRLAAGEGPVWNVGERVQGYTNLGWVAVMTAVHLLGLPLRLNPLAVQLINVALHVGLVALVFGFVERRRGLVPALLAGWLTATSAPLLYWGALGFETTLQALLFSAALLPLLDDRDDASARALPWAAAAFVVRPDAGLLLVLLALLAAPSLLRAPGRAPGFLGAAAAIVLAVLAFQRLYYGAWLPNTIALKASGGSPQVGRGLAYLGDFVLNTFPLALVPIIAAVAAVKQRRWQRLRVPAVFALWTVYLILVGGDAFPLSRFWVPLVPVLCAQAALLVDAMFASPNLRPPRARSLGAAAVTLVALAVPAGTLLLDLSARPSVPTLLGRDALWAQSAVRVAAGLRDRRLMPGAHIGVFWAGTLPYFMPEWRCHDLLGKTDRVIAHTAVKWGRPGHNKWDYRHSLDTVAPDILVTVAPFTGLTDARARASIDRQSGFGFHPALWVDPTFVARYRANRLALPAARDGPILNWVYARSGSAAARSR